MYLMPALAGRSNHDPGTLQGMRSLEALQELTPDDMARHARDVARLRRCLFQRRTPAECFVFDAEVIVAPSVYVLFDLVSGKPTRNLALGGLEYKIVFPHAQAPRWITVQHCRGELYWLHAKFHDSRKLVDYTRFSLTVPLEIVGRNFLSRIDEMAAECKPP